MNSSNPGQSTPAILPLQYAGPTSAGLSSSPPAVSSAMDGVALLRALQRRWALALGAGLLCAAAAALAAWHIVPPARYTARALLQLSTDQPKIIFETAEQRAAYTTYQRTHTKLIRSRRVLEAALEKCEVAALDTVKGQVDPFEWLEEQIKVDFPGGPEILEISLSGNRPNDLAVLVNAVTESYLQTIEGLERGARLDRLGKLERLYQDYQAELETKRAKLREPAESMGSSDTTAVYPPRRIMRL